MATLQPEIAIAYLNRADGATITTTSEASGYPNDNLNVSRLSLSWRSSSLASHNIDADLGASATDIDVMALLGVNLTDDATSAPIISGASNYTSPTYAPGADDAFDITNAPILDYSPVTGRNLISLPGTSITGRYTRFTLTDAANPDNYMSARTYWAGPIWQSPHGITAESELSPVIIGNPGLERYLRRWTIKFINLTRAQAVQLESILLNKLRSGRYLIIPHPTRPETFNEEVIYATMTGAPSKVMVPSFPYWTVTVEFTEVAD